MELLALRMILVVRVDVAARLCAPARGATAGREQGEIGYGQDPLGVLGALAHAAMPPIATSTAPIMTAGSMPSTNYCPEW
jgi:hypothetical protein